MAAISTRSLVLLGSALMLTGCSNNDAPPAAPTAPVAEAKAEAKSEAKPAPAPTKAVAATLTSAQRAWLHVPFKDAVLFDPPDGELPPGDRTAGGKSIAHLYEEIAGRDGQPGLWDQVRFVDDAGRAIHYRVALSTQAGEIVIDLFPEEAPNHCRNFIALVKAGFFDGLPFHRSVLAPTAEPPVAYVESGCPQGTGEVGKGHLNYWLKPEIGTGRTHEAGTVGAWHREEVETAACRFYITAVPMPQMDREFTIFGKVSRGLDVVRTINARPANEDRPIEPVAIQRATLLVN